MGLNTSSTLLVPVLGTAMKMNFGLLDMIKGVPVNLKLEVKKFADCRQVETG